MRVETKKKSKATNGISVSLFLIIIMSMIIALILALIKIYLSNQIYYESRRINYIEREVSALREERMMLVDQVQQLKFKNRVADTIFVSDETQEIE